MRELRSFTASEELFQQVLNQNRIWYWEVDENWKVIHCAEETARQFMGTAYPAFTETGKIPAEIFAPGERDKARLMMRQLSMGRKQVTGEVQLWNNARGMFGWYRVIATTMEERDGVIRRVLCTAQDIEEYHQQQRIYNDEQEFRRKISSTLMSSSRVNLTRGIVEEISHNTGATVPENVATMTSYRDRVSFLFSRISLTAEELDKLDPPALLEMYQNGQTAYVTEYLAISKDGTEDFGLQVEVRMRVRPETGDLVGFYYTRDVGRQFVLQSAAKALISFNHDYSGVISINTGRMYAVAGGIDDEMHSFDYEQGVRDHFLVSCPEEERAGLFDKLCLETVQRELEQNDYYTVEVNMNIRGEGVRKKQIAFSYVNRRVRVLAIVRTDIENQIRQERKREEELSAALDLAEAASNAKTEFLSSVSHEIRTPLNAILGLTTLIKEDSSVQEDSILEEWVRQMEVAGKHLLNLINDILDVSVVNGGDFELHPEPYSPPEFESLISDIFIPMSEAKGITFSVNIVGDRPTVLVDRKRKNQLFYNLLSNAIKYTSRGGKVTLTVDARQEGDMAYFLYEIADNGIGITPEFQKIMFEPFAQEETLPGSERGSGLGLSIVKAIVDKMDGTIEVESEVGKGTTVRLRMAYPTTERKYERDALSEIRFDGQKIMVVEDQQINRKIVRKLLENRGASVVTAADGEEGLNRFKNSEPFEYAAVLMDIRMPKMDGYTSTSQIRGLNRPDAGTVPIIAMTANTYDEDRNRSAQAGMSAFLSKPVDVRELLDTLTRLMR